MIWDGISKSNHIYYGMDDSRKGDYYRYLAEFKTDQERKEAADQSLKGYEACLFLNLSLTRTECFDFYLLSYSVSPLPNSR